MKPKGPFHPEASLQPVVLHFYAAWPENWMFQFLWERLPKKVIYTYINIL